MSVSIVGGTGEFEGAHGQFEYDYDPVGSDYDEDGNPCKPTYGFWGEGRMGLVF